MSDNTMNLSALEPEQAAELRGRLRAVVGEAALNRAVAAIDVAMDAYTVVMPADWKEREARAYRHLDAVEKAAEGLRHLLSQGRPMWNANSLDWEALDATLKTVADLARDEGASPKSREGRPAKEGSRRDDLIAVIFSVYPKGTAEPKSKHFSHAVATVRDVLGYLDEYRDNVRPLVKEALKRRPEPPFIIVNVRD